MKYFINPTTGSYATAKEAPSGDYNEVSREDFDAHIGAINEQAVQAKADAVTDRLAAIETIKAAGYASVEEAVAALLNA